MKDYTHTELSCNNLQKFTEIMKNVTIKNAEIIFKDGTALINSADCFPDKEIERLSKENPDLVFTARHRIKFNMSYLDHIVEFIKGKSKEIGVEACYYVVEDEENDFGRIEVFMTHMGDSYSRLYDEAIEIFRRIDIVKEDEKGVKNIDFVSGITLKVEDEHFQMILSKNESLIKILNCFEKVVVPTIELVSIEDTPFA